MLNNESTIKATKQPIKQKFHRPDLKKEQKTKKEKKYGLNLYITTKAQRRVNMNMSEYEWRCKEGYEAVDANFPHTGP